MTPFAQLGSLEKSAYQTPPAGYDYGVNARSGLRDPYAAYQPQAGTTAALKSTPRWGEIENGWGDFAVSAIPFVGSAYMGNKAIQNFRRGEWWSGIGNGLAAGLSLIPGVGLAKGIVGAAGKGGMALAKGAWNGAKTTGGLGTKGMLGATVASVAAPMLDPSSSAPTNPNAYGTPTKASSPHAELQRTMVGSLVNNGMPAPTAPTATP